MSLHRKWNSHVINKVLELNGKKIAYRELISSLFDEFMGADENYKDWKTEIIKKMEKEVSHLENMIPKRTYPKITIGNITKRVNDDGLRGGSQFYVTAPIISDGQFIGWLGQNDETEFISAAIPKEIINAYKSKTDVLLRSSKPDSKRFVEDVLKLETLSKYDNSPIGKSETTPLVLEEFRKIENFSNYYDMKKGLVLGKDDDELD